MLNLEELIALRAGVVELLEKGPKYARVGICGNLWDCKVGGELWRFFEGWPEHSGVALHPIDGTSEVYEENRDKAWQGETLRKRISLLNYMLVKIDLAIAEAKHVQHI